MERRLRRLACDSRRRATGHGTAAGRLFFAASLVLACTAQARAAIIWCWGDSISASYADQLAARRPDDVVVNDGVFGEITADSLTRARATLAQGPTLPDVVVIATGTNDVYQQAFHVIDETGDQAADNVAAIRQLFFDAGVPHVITATTIFAPPAGDHSEWIRTYRARLRAMNPWVEFRFVRRYLSDDGIHPGGWGQIRLAARVSRAIDRVLQSHG